ncbi:hypothetical protein [Cellulosimicrobium sp. Marseille-Q4280]|uniref:hypothetical protein n=1 Tax=Cellulosimicrobium sp. Marseille-Q4280 TaxID=2937992 RepID=UPI002040BA65|nr:hypothetical protein [Cellulosimicrobium sp. Marseille-Q4280]
MAINAAAVVLPELLGSRGSAAALIRRSVPAGTTEVAVSAAHTVTVAASAAAELVKVLLDVGVDRVVLVEANERVESHLRDALDRQARPERTFLLTAQRGREDAVYRT